MIDVVYTGDIRHAQKVRAKNHSKLLKKLDCKVSEFYYGTKRGEKDFFGCPFDRGGKDAYWRWDNLRRGQGGGVQVWQFANAVRLTKNPIIIRLRNDVWFGEGSIKVIMSEIKKIEDGENDICFLGSNWLEGAMGAEYEISNKFKRVEDFFFLNKLNNIMTITQNKDYEKADIIREKLRGDKKVQSMRASAAAAAKRLDTASPNFFNSIVKSMPIYSFANHLYFIQQAVHLWLFLLANTFCLMVLAWRARWGRPHSFSARSNAMLSVSDRQVVTLTQRFASPF